CAFVCVAHGALFLCACRNTLFRKARRRHGVVVLPGLSCCRRIGGIHRFIAADIGLGILVVGIAPELALELFCRGAGQRRRRRRFLLFVVVHRSLPPRDSARL